MKNEAQLIWETLQRVNEADDVPPHDDAVDHDNQDVPPQTAFAVGDFVDIEDPDDPHASNQEWVVVQVEDDAVTVARVDENDVRTLSSRSVTKPGGNGDRGAVEPASSVGSYASGDPREYKIGQVLKSAQTGDDLDGIIVDIYEEDGSLMFALMEVGEEGWSVKASDIRSDHVVPRTNF